MTQFFADRHPAVWVRGIGQLPHLMPHIAIGLIDIMLLELFHKPPCAALPSFFLLKASDSVRSLSSQKAVSVFSAGQLAIIVGEIVGGEGVVSPPASCRPRHTRYIDASAEHQVFRRDGRTLFWPDLRRGRPHRTKHSQQRPSACFILLYQYPQAVIKTESIELYHAGKGTDAGIKSRWVNGSLLYTASVL